AKIVDRLMAFSSNGKAPNAISMPTPDADLTNNAIVQCEFSRLLDPGRIFVENCLNELVFGSETGERRHINIDRLSWFAPADQRQPANDAEFPPVPFAETCTSCATFSTSFTMRQFHEPSLLLDEARNRLRRARRNSIVIVPAQQGDGFL